MKLVTFICRPAAKPRSEFQSWFSDAGRPQLAREAVNRLAGVVRTVIDVPGLPPRAGADAFLDYDLVLETWYGSMRAHLSDMSQFEARLRQDGASYITYRVQSIMQKDPRYAEACGSRPLRTAIFAWQVAPEKALTVAVRHWTEHHADIALQNQPDLTKYEQNVVVDVVAKWTETELISAFADFSMPHERPVVGSEAELADVRNFAGAGHRAYLSDARPLG